MCKSIEGLNNYKENILTHSKMKTMKNQLTSKYIIQQAEKFKKDYKNPEDGIPSPKEFSWYLVGRVDQLHEKYDKYSETVSKEFQQVREDFLEEFKNARNENKEDREIIAKNISSRLPKATFWKVVGLVTTLFGVVIAILASKRIL